MFQVETHTTEAASVIRYQISKGTQLLSYAEVLELWQRDEPFRAFFTSVLAASPFAGFRWETPALDRDSAGDPFEFVLVNTPAFATLHTDPNTYSEYFTDTDEDQGIVSFTNLSKDATLVVPSPRALDEAYGHLAAFVRRAPEAQVDCLWQVLGRTASGLVSEQPIWMSTAGGGVAWLHVRLDRKPKYYAHSSYKRNSR